MILRKLALYFTLLFTCLFIDTMAQDTLVLKPNVGGKDALIEDRRTTQNFGAINDFGAVSWTNSGNDVTARGLIEFDLSELPCNAIISGASLSLYTSTSSANGPHSTSSGSNSCKIQRITSPWSEATVTWVNKPSVTTNNEVSLSASTTSTQDYTNIDVTDLVQDILDNPATSFGFMIKLDTEIKYRRLMFASSENTDTSAHPKLELYYTVPSVTYTDTVTVNVYDTTAVTVYDTVTINRYDTSYVNIYDTTHISVYDTTHITIYDTTYITIADSVLYDTVFIFDTVFIYDTTFVSYVDTSYVSIFDTTRLTYYDTIYYQVYTSTVDTLLIDLYDSSGCLDLKLQLYPNPSKDILYLSSNKINCFNGSEVRIVTQLGQVLETKPYNTPQIYFNLKGYAQALYYIELIDANGVTRFTKKFVVR